MNSNPPPQLHYRPEIDGLRAVAVLAVIIFHAGASLPGGFVGVDIFYVISGFLITRIILTSLQQESFSYSTFYARRMKRLLPAALFMLLATLIFGFWILTPDKYSELGKSAIHASLFLANVWFANHAGYFDQAADISPLVHLWSLAVEEQFYLLFPLLLVFSYGRRGSSGVRYAILTVFTISLLLSLILSGRYPNFFILFAADQGMGALYRRHAGVSAVSRLSIRIHAQPLAQPGRRTHLLRLLVHIRG